MTYVDLHCRFRDPKAGSDLSIREALSQEGKHLLFSLSQSVSCDDTRHLCTEPDPRRKLQLFARMVHLLQERLAPIWQVVLEAAPTDAELRSFVTELQERHVGSMRLVIEHLGEAGRLRPTISKDIARDVLWAMNSPEFYRLLVVGRRWTGEEFENWLADAWQRLLLDDDASSTSQRVTRA